MNIFRRLVLVFTFPIIGYFAAYAGDAVKLLKDKPTNELNEPAIALVIITATFVVGVMHWFSAVSLQLKGEANKQATSALRAVVALICLSFVFGYLTNPFTLYGDYPWEWKTKYSFLLILAFVPLIFVLESVVRDSVEILRKLTDTKAE